MVPVMLVLVFASCLNHIAYGQTECEFVELSKCARNPCTDPATKCPGGRCVPCGCKAMCVASAAAEQYPLVQCPDGSAALQCKIPINKIGCSNVRCAGVPCKEYLCGGRCTALCVGGTRSSSSITVSDGNAGSNAAAHSLAATARPLQPASYNTPTPPAKPAPAAVTGAAVPPTIKCDDGSKAVPCQVPMGTIGCSNARCAGVPCKAFMCGDRCQAVCMAGEITLLSSNPSSSTAGHNLAAAAVPIVATNGGTNVPLTTAVTAGANNPQKQHTVECADGSAAVQCSVARGQVGCSHVKCAGMPCKEYICGGRCMPMCLSSLMITSAAPAGNYSKPPQPIASATQQIEVKHATSSSGSSRSLMALPDSSGSNSTADAFTCLNGPPVACFHNPCDDKKCPPGFSCKAEYCGGCNAACLPDQPPCKSGGERRPCMQTANRCLLAKFCCGHTCVPDQCNDCAATAVGPCPPGQFVSRFRLQCLDCPRGSSCAGGNSTTVTAEPKPCNGGFYADEPGLVECKQCGPGLTTPALPKRRGYTTCQPEG